MTTIESLPEDLFYLILSKCSSSIDMWHLLMALGYERTQRINLRAFWRYRFCEYSKGEFSSLALFFSVIFD